MKDREKRLDEKAFELQQLGRANIERFIKETGKITMPSGLLSNLTDALLDTGKTAESIVTDALGIEASNTQSTHYAIRYLLAFQAITAFEQNGSISRNEEHFSPLLDSSSELYITYAKHPKLDVVHIEHSLQTQHLFEDANEIKSVKKALSNIWKEREARMGFHEQVRDAMFESVGKVIQMEEAVETDELKKKSFSQARQAVISTFKK